MPVINGVAYPDLRPLEEAIKLSARAPGKFFHYEPGNGTRYEVFLALRCRTTHAYDEYYPRLLVAIMNFDRPCSMSIPIFNDELVGPVSIPYMCDKMKILPGDAWALLPLINSFLTLERLAQDAGLE